MEPTSTNETPLLVERDEELAMTPQEPAPVSRRVYSMDLLRGFIMVIMAWDHCKDILMSPDWAPKKGSGESWSGPFAEYDNNLLFFFVRVVSHICAPGFFFTMGSSIVLFGYSRMKPSLRSGKEPWPLSKVIRHFFVRGLILILIGRIVDVPFWVGPIVKIYEGRNVTFYGHIYEPTYETKLTLWTNAFFGVFEVMTGLGLTLITCATLFLKPMLKMYEKVPRIWPNKADSVANISGPEVFGWIMFAIIFAISNVCIVAAQHGDPTQEDVWPQSNIPASNFGQLLARLFMFPGKGLGSMGNISYPVIPWAGITFLGMGFGFGLKNHQEIAHKRALVISIAFLVSFFVIRTWGGAVGNTRGMPRHEGDDINPFIAFFSLAKYPPSLAYAFITLSVDLFFLWVFSSPSFSAVAEVHSQIAPVAEQDVENDQQTQSRNPLVCFGKYHLAKPLLVFGRVPLLFYVLHFWVYALISCTLLVIFPEDKYNGFSLPVLPLLWLAVLAGLYPVCITYYDFKSKTHPESIWRML